jgi:hypothetical protein
MTRKKNNFTQKSNMVTRSKSKNESSSNILHNESSTVLNENNTVFNENNNDDYDDDDNNTKLLDDDNSTKIFNNASSTSELNDNADTSDDGISTVDDNDNNNSLLNVNNLVSTPKKLNSSRDRNITFFERQKKEKDSLTDKTDETNKVDVQESTDKSLQWLTELQKTYNKPEFHSYLDDSGRIFNGSEEVFKKVENVKCLTNPQFPEPTSYIYIISKQMGGDIYYKIGIGGTGYKNNIDDEIQSGRLGSAQTFLVIGLGEEASFKVHYLFFFKQKKRETLEKNGSHVIEQLIHKFLQNDIFRSASILFPSGARSEWYLVPMHQQKLFLGIVFDLMGFFTQKQTQGYPYKPCEIWKLVPTKNAIDNRPAFFEDSCITDIKLPVDYGKRLGTAPQFVVLENLLPEQRIIITIQPRSPDVDDNKVWECLKKIEMMSMERFTIQFEKIVIIPEKQEQEYVLCSRKNETDSTWRLFDRWKQTVKENEKIKIYSMKEIVNDDDVVVLSRFFISLFDVLTLLKKKRNTLDSVLQNKLFYMQMKKRNTIIIQERQQRRLNIKSVPQWYFNNDTQKIWADIFREPGSKYKQYEFHKDVSINSSDNAQYRWKVTGQSEENKIITLKREAFNDDGTSTGITESSVPVWRVMMILNVMGKKKTKEDEMKEVYVKRHQKIEKGAILTIDSDYFTYLNEDYTLADMGEVREEFYKVKKIYKKHAKTSNEAPVYMDITLIGVKGETPAEAEERPIGSRQETFYIQLDDLKNKGKLKRIQNPIVVTEGTKTMDLLKYFNDKEVLLLINKKRIKMTFSLGNILKFKKTALRIKCTSYGVELPSIPEIYEDPDYGYLKIVEAHPKKKPLYYTLRFLEQFDKESKWDVLLGYSIVQDLDIFEKVADEGNRNLEQYRKFLKLDIKSIVNTLPITENIPYSFIPHNKVTEIIVNNHTNFSKYCQSINKKVKYEVVKIFSNKNEEIEVDDKRYTGLLKEMIDNFWENLKRVPGRMRNKIIINNPKKQTRKKSTTAEKQTRQQLPSSSSSSSSSSSPIRNSSEVIKPLRISPSTKKTLYKVDKN